MKKIIIFFIFILTFLINKNVYANEQLENSYQYLNTIRSIYSNGTNNPYVLSQVSNISAVNGEYYIQNYTDRNTQAGYKWENNPIPWEDLKNNFLYILYYSNNCGNTGLFLSQEWEDNSSGVSYGSPIINEKANYWKQITTGVCVAKFNLTEVHTTRENISLEQYLLTSSPTSYTYKFYYVSSFWSKNDYESSLESLTTLQETKDFFQNGWEYGTTNTSGLNFTKPSEIETVGNSITFEGFYINAEHWDTIAIQIFNENGDVIKQFKEPIPTYSNPLEFFSYRKILTDLIDGKYYWWAFFVNSQTMRIGDKYPSDNIYTELPYFIKNTSSGNGGSNENVGNIGTGLLSELPESENVICDIELLNETNNMPLQEELKNCFKKAIYWIIFPSSDTKKLLNETIEENKNNLFFMPLRALAEIGRSSSANILTLNLPFGLNNINPIGSNFVINENFDRTGSVMLWGMFVAVWGWYIIRKIWF